MDRRDAGIRRHFTEKKCAPDIADERNRRAGHDKQCSAPESHPVKFAKEKRDHEGRLERAHAGAGIVDPDPTGTQFDDVAVLHGERADEIQNLGW